MWRERAAAGDRRAVRGGCTCRGAGPYASSRHLSGCGGTAGYRRAPGVPGVGGSCGAVRLAVPAGGRRGRIRGYATRAERHSKQQRLQALRARLAEAERRLDAGRVSVCRGGRDLFRKRNRLAWAGMDAAQWRERWESARMFRKADGEAGKPLGNETIRWNPDGGWLELKLPATLAHLANGPHGRYRLSCPVEFTYRGDEVAAQAWPGRPARASAAGRGPEPRSPRRLDHHSRRQPRRPARHAGSEAGVTGGWWRGFRPGSSGTGSDREVPGPDLPDGRQRGPGRDRG